MTEKKRRRELGRLRRAYMKCRRRRAGRRLRRAVAACVFLAAFYLFALSESRDKLLRLSGERKIELLTEERGTDWPQGGKDGKEKDGKGKDGKEKDRKEKDGGRRNSSEADVPDGQAQEKGSRYGVIFRLKDGEITFFREKREVE